MKNNVGGWDRNLRWILGGAALIASFTAPIPKGWRFGLLSFGAAELITATMRHCPINRALGINTRETRIRNVTKAAVGLAKAFGF